MGWLDKGLSNYANDFQDALNEIAKETSVTDLLFKNLMFFLAVSREEYILLEHFYKYGGLLTH